MSKVKSIASILRRRRVPLTAVDICSDLRSMGIDAKPHNVRSLLAQSFDRFVSLTPGLWQLQDPAMSLLDRIILYEKSRGRSLDPGSIAALDVLHRAQATRRAPRNPARPMAFPAKRTKARPAAKRVTAPVEPRAPEPKITKLDVACPSCHKRDVVADKDNWSICLGCGHVGG